MEIGADLFAGEGMARLASVGECRPWYRARVILYFMVGQIQSEGAMSWMVSGSSWQNREIRRGRVRRAPCVTILDPKRT